MRGSLRPLLLVLAGCGYSTTYPVFSVADTDVIGPGEVPTTMPCGVDGPLGTLLITAETWVPDVLTILEVVPTTCEEVPQTSLAPGQSIELQVVTGHVWVVRDEAGTYLSWFQVPVGETDWQETVP